MDRFDEPKPYLKAQEDALTFKSEPPSDNRSVPIRLATEPAQLALTRADRTPQPPKEDGAPDWDPISDWFSLGKPLLCLILLLSIPWIFTSSVMQGTDSVYLERARAYAEASRAEAAGNNLEAIRWIKQARSVLPPIVNGKPEDSVTANRYTYMFSTLGRLYAKLGDYSTARNYYGRAVELLPFLGDHSWDTWTHLHYGWMLRRDGRSDLAIKELEAATKAKDLSENNWSFAWRELAMAYNNVGRYKDALAAAQRSVEKTSKNELFWDNVRRDIISGDAYEGMNRHTEAMEKYKSSAESGINHAAKFAGDYLRGGGIFLGPVNHGFTALRWLNEALVKLRQPDSGIFDAATVLNDLANHAVLMNDLPRAVGYLEQAKLFDLKKTDKENNIDYARDLYNLGRVKMLMNNVSGAKADLEHCLQIRKKLLGEKNFLTQQVVKLLATLKIDAGATPGLQSR